MIKPTRFLYSIYLLTLLVLPPVAVATQPVSTTQSLIPASPQIAAMAYLLIDAKSGKVLVSEDADREIPPASLTKMMTSYIAAKEIAKGNITLDDQVRVSIKAWQAPGSRMFIKEGTTVTVSDLLRGIIIQSGNDASTALAEHIAGSEDAFSDLMNQYAQLLGMSHSHFMNATGLPSDQHYSSAEDLAKLAVAIIRDHPEHYAIYSEKYFTYNGIRQPNRNKLLWRDKSVDGLKTGHTEEAGYCLVASAQARGMRLISVVMGARSEEARASESQKLMTWGFRYYENRKLYAAQQSLQDIRLWGGAVESLSLGLEQDLYLTIPRNQADNLKIEIEVDSFIQAPVEKGAVLGRLMVKLQDKILIERPLVANQAGDSGSFFKRIWDQILIFFIQLMN